MNLTEQDQTRIAHPLRPVFEGLAIGLFSLIAMSICIYFIYVRALSKIIKPNLMVYKARLIC